MSSAHATTCDPGNHETLILSSVPAMTPGTNSADESPNKLGVSSLSRHISTHSGNGTIPYCVYASGPNLGLYLERVEVIEGTPEVEQYIEEMESKQTPRARVCGSRPYRAVHPGVYKYTKACSDLGGGSTEAWPLDATLRVDETRSGVLVQYKVAGVPQSETYGVDSATFREPEGGEGCNLQGAPKNAGLLAFALLGGLWTLRRRGRRA